MGVKKRNSYQLNWSATANIPYNQNVAASGVTNGVMTGTLTIYSNVQNVSNFDNLGLVVTYTGTPTGTLSILGSEFGDVFYALTFNPALTQPAGGAGGYLINLNQFPWAYLMVQYVNASGSGILTVSMGYKDLN